MMCKCAHVSEAQITDWPAFRGPGGMGASANKGVPANWSSSQNLVWKREMPGPGGSTPIVFGNRVFVTCFTGYAVPGAPGGSISALKRHLLCLDRTTGSITWQKTVAAAQPEEGSVREHGYASSTPAADSERVYAFFGKSGVFAFTHAGQQIWHASVGTQIHGWGSAASAVLHGDLVIINASVESESLVALNKRTGKEVWRTGGIKEAWNTPLLVPTAGGKVELVVPTIGTVLGFDPATGKQLWSCQTGIAWYMVPSLVADGGVVYCIGGRTGAALAIRCGGRGDVTNTHKLWTGKKGSNVSSPILHEGRLYWMHDDLGLARCADAKTGAILYEERVAGAGQFYASPVLADGKLYYVSRNSGVFVVAATPKYQLLAHNVLGDRSTFDASPAVTGNWLLVRSDRFLYCIGKK